jgi:hypothetical protein
MKCWRDGYCWRPTERRARTANLLSAFHGELRWKGNSTCRSASRALSQALTLTLTLTLLSVCFPIWLTSLPTMPYLLDELLLPEYYVFVPGDPGF